MPTLPVHAPPVVRTHFGDDAAWAALTEAVATPSDEGFLADGVLVDDPAYDGLGTDDVLAALPADANPAVLFIADADTSAGATSRAFSTARASTAGSQLRRGRAAGRVR